MADTEKVDENVGVPTPGPGVAAGGGAYDTRRWPREKIEAHRRPKDEDNADIPLSNLAERTDGESAAGEKEDVVSTPNPPTSWGS